MCERHRVRERGRERESVCVREKGRWGGRERERENESWRATDGVCVCV